MPDSTASPLLHPTVIFGIFGVLATLAGLVAWFVRLESKTNANALEVERVKKEIEEKSVESKKQRDATEKKILDHMMDEKRHYNEQFMSEFRASLDRRFTSLESTLKDIDHKIERAIK